MKRLSFDELIKEATKYYLEEVEVEGFKGNQFGCKIWKTHVPGWYLTDYDHRYYKLPDLYNTPNLLERTGYYALFKDNLDDSALHVSSKILRFKEHATDYINKIIDSTYGKDNI